MAPAEVRVRRIYDPATQEDGIRPTQEGTAVAKDVWLVGAGLSLLTHGLRRR